MPIGIDESTLLNSRTKKKMYLFWVEVDSAITEEETTEITVCDAKRR